MQAGLPNKFEFFGRTLSENAKIYHCTKLYLVIVQSCLTKLRSTRITEKKLYLCPKT